MERYNDIKNSIAILKKYNYHKIFSYTCDDKLLLSITLSAFVENIGITYLRLLSGNPYYRDDRFFIRDFIVHFASFLHSINVIYKYSLNDEKIMNFFRVFAVKNIKLLCIFKCIWKISFESFSNRLKDPSKYFLMQSKKSGVNTVIDSNTYERKCFKLEVFNSEIQSLLEFISKINLNLKFKKEFKLLETSESFSLDRLVNMVKNFDEEKLLEFFIEECDLEKDGEEIKDPAYFLNSLDMEHSIPSNILTDIESKLFFIENKCIKKYFIEMLLVSCSGDSQQLMQKIGQLFKKIIAINSDKKPPKKHLKLAKFDCKLKDNVQP